MPATKVTPKAAPKAAKVEPKAPTMKPYSEMTKDEMIKLGVYIDVIEDYFPE